jgi:hypothetical protein
MPAISQVVKSVRLGPMAELIRNAMKDKGFDPNSLADQFEDPRKTLPNIRLWVNARGVPGLQYRAKLAEVLELSEQDLIPPTKEQTLKLVRKEKSPTPKSEKAPIARSPMSMTIQPDGNLHIRLDVAISYETAQPLVELIMDYLKKGLLT